MGWGIIYSAPDRMWTVGFYDPKGTWHAISDHATEDEAAAKINYLNGGSGRKMSPAYKPKKEENGDDDDSTEGS